MTDTEIIDGILTREGSEYSDRPADRGGPTKYGITRRTLSEWRGCPCTAADVQALTESEARAIYQGLYIDGPGFGAIADDTLRVLLVDWGVHSGPARAVLALQEILGVTRDGRIGPQTWAALAQADVTAVAAALWRARSRYIVDVVLGDPLSKAFLRAHPSAQLANLRGWNNRLLGLWPSR